MYFTFSGVTIYKFWPNVDLDVYEFQMVHVSDILNGFWGVCLILRTLVNGQYGLKFFEINLNFKLMTFLKIGLFTFFP